MQPHPWNAGFTWTEHTGPSRRLTTEQLAQFDAEGYVVVPDLVDADTVAAVRADLDGFEAEVDAFLKTRDDGRFSIAETGALTVALHAVTRSPAAEALSRHPAILGLCADLVGPDVRLYWDQAVYKKTEKPRRVPWHQDNGYTYVEPQEYLTVWLALTDATLDNGCPRVAPGLHMHGTLAHYYVEPLGFECFTDPPSPRGEEVAPVKASGAVVFSSLMPHLTGPNLTDEVRKAYIVQYAPAGAHTRTDDGNVPCDDPDRQFPVLRNGRAV